MRESVFGGHINGLLQSHIKGVLKWTEPCLAALLISLALFTAAAPLCVFECKREQTGISPLIKTSFSALYCRAPVRASHRTLLSHYSCTIFIVPLWWKPLNFSEYKVPLLWDVERDFRNSECISLKSRVFFVRWLWEVKYTEKTPGNGKEAF